MVEADRREAFKRRMAAARAYCMTWRGTSEATQAAIGRRAASLLATQLPAATVSRYFGARIPDVETIEALAEAMGVDPGWLAFGPKSLAPTPSGADALDAIRRALEGPEDNHRTG